jgi:hypothetical protein
MFVPRAGPLDRTARARLTNQIRLRPARLRRRPEPHSPLRPRADAALPRWENPLSFVRPQPVEARHLAGGLVRAGVKEIEKVSHR